MVAREAWIRGGAGCVEPRVNTDTDLAVLLRHQDGVLSAPRRSPAA